MNVLKICGLALVFLCCTLSLTGQTDKIKKRTITVKTYDGETESTEEGPRPEFLVAAVKVNPLLIAIGDYPVSVEYSPVDALALEFGLGVTFKNFMEGEHQMAESDVRYTPGYSMMVNFKWFPNEDAFDDGGYYSLQYSRRVYNREYVFNPSGKVYEEQDIKETYSFIYGWQFFFNNRFFLEGYIGFGLEKVKGTGITEAYDQSGKLVGYSSYTYSSREDDDFIGVFSGYSFPFGIKLGYMF